MQWADLYELRAVLGGVLALHMEVADDKAHALDGGHGQLAQLALLLQAEDGGAVGAGLIEVGLDRGPVVGHIAVDNIPI